MFELTLYSGLNQDPVFKKGNDAYFFISKNAKCKGMNMGRNPCPERLLQQIVSASSVFKGSFQGFCGHSNLSIGFYAGFYVA